ncbi:MAG: T9SS type A sorting domain-containing protein [Bacteroidales bacterium]|nr:T9SS type A sorting domain-containing protein [Bacteroidales bacterium]
MTKISLHLTLFLLPFMAFPQEVVYSGSWGKAGYTLQEQGTEGIRVGFSVTRFVISDVQINGEGMSAISLPEAILPNQAGAPDLPGLARYIAVPAGATATLRVTASRTETLQGMNIAPAPRIPWDTEREALDYQKDETIYSADRFYPETPVILSETGTIRGVDVVLLGITPFGYNPVSKELIIYRDLEVEISFEGGTGLFGDERLRSRWWDPILRDMLLNEASLPDLDYGRMYRSGKEDGCEYLIISPDGAEFQSWADSISLFRNRQGILTDVVTLSEIGGNTANSIETYLNNAYNTWTIPPAAVLFLGDYGTNASNSIIAPIWTNYCASDNIFADVNGDNLPDIVHARITAQNAAHLETMVGKFLSYERNPPTNPHYYDHPITAMGWQTERWFQICSEVINGFWEFGLGKEPVRENNIYEGTPTGIWSTAQNTNTVVAYFGPAGLGYIPQTPDHLIDWNADAESINADINAGAFMMVHRDHGYEQGWGEPDYSSSDLTGLSNDDLIYVFSVNCLTGKYNMSGECFTEAFHRHQQGALGLIAASEVSYSFVNDTYVWGLMDNLWPQFMPGFGTNPPSRDILPAFGNAAGKYFLQQSGWPYNTSNKLVTYHLFHPHGDAFSTVYSHMPQELTVLHNGALLDGASTYSVVADTCALICLSVNGEIIGVAEATGEPVDVQIISQPTGTTVELTVTRQDYYRHTETIPVVPANVPYVVYESHLLDDTGGNNNGLMDYGETIQLTVTMENIGMQAASNVNVTLGTAHPEITITDGTETFGNFTPGSTVTRQDAFTFDVSGLINDQDKVVFDLEANDGSNTWMSYFLIVAHAPDLGIESFGISDPSGNGNGRLDPGETADISITLVNEGSSGAMNVTGTLSCSDPVISISQATQSYGNLNPGASAEKSFTVTVDPAAPQGHQVTFEISITADGGVTTQGSFITFIGKFPVLILDLDPKNYSGPEIYNTFQEIEVYADYATAFPPDLGLYKNIFVCLGIHFNNHVLTETEGQQLRDFLLEGGNLYMEGKVTWLNDPPTPVHPMFDIIAVQDTWFEYLNILGMPGTLTNGMDFGYTGENPYNNYYLEPDGQAHVIFTVQDPLMGCGIANDEGDYRTIGTTFEFGKLADGASPSTKPELMQIIMDFFDGLITGNPEERPASLTDARSISVYPNPFREEVVIMFTTEKDSRISVEIFASSGQLVSTLIHSLPLDPGMHQVSWKGTSDSGRTVPAGIYLVRISDGKEVVTTRMVRID